MMKCYVVFVSNKDKTVPLWQQKAGSGDDKEVVWDYHAFLVCKSGQAPCMVFDPDTDLDFPVDFNTYVTETFKTEDDLEPNFHRFFRIVPAIEYMQNIANDRRLVKKPDGTWVTEAPNRPNISNDTARQSLDDFTNMDPDDGNSDVLDLPTFKRRFR